MVGGPGGRFLFLLVVLLLGELSSSLIATYREMEKEIKKMSHILFAGNILPTQRQGEIKIRNQSFIVGNREIKQLHPYFSSSSAGGVWV